MSVRMTGLALSGVAKITGHIGVTFDVSNLCKIQVTTVRLRFASKGVLEVLVRFRALQTWHWDPLGFGARWPSSEFLRIIQALATSSSPVCQADAMIRTQPIRKGDATCCIVSQVAAQ
jgi:hypothetical protein